MHRGQSIPLFVRCRPPSRINTQAESKGKFVPNVCSEACSGVGPSWHAEFMLCMNSILRVFGGFFLKLSCIFDFLRVLWPASIGWL